MYFLKALVMDKSPELRGLLSQISEKKFEELKTCVYFTLYDLALGGTRRFIIHSIFKIPRQLQSKI